MLACYMCCLCISLKSLRFAAVALGIPANRVVCKVKRMGGGFGGKETRSVNLSTAVAVAAAKLQRPVRCILERNADMQMMGHRHPFLGTYFSDCANAND